MYLFSELEQPYGLLSNYAKTPFVLDNNVWQCVEEYIYTSVLQTPELRAKMRADFNTFKYGDIHGEAARRDARYWQYRYRKHLLDALDIVISPKDVAHLVGFNVVYPKNEDVAALINSKIRLASPEPEDLEAFKEDLVDKYLDYLIATKFKNIPEKDYEKAKQEQLVFSSTADRDEFYNDIYKKYRKGELPRGVIENINIGDTPVKLREKIITVKSSLAPSNIKDIVIDRLTYMSPHYYAYSKVFTDMGFGGIEVNSFTEQELANLFQAKGLRRFHSAIRTNAKLGTQAKFKEYPVLGYLLKTTGDRFIWADTRDPILGIGPKNNGENYTGKLLEEQRTKGVIDEKHTRPLKNVYIRNWVIMRLKDLYNSVLLFNTVSLAELQQLYRFPASKASGFTGLSKKDRDIIREELPEIDDNLLAILWEMIYPQIYTMFNLDDQNLTICVVKAQDQYLSKIERIGNSEKHLVRRYLEKYYNQNRDNIRSTSAEDFIVKVLTGNYRAAVESADIFASVKYPRIAYWAELAGKIEKVRG